MGTDAIRWTPARLTVVLAAGLFAGIALSLAFGSSGARADESELRGALTDVADTVSRAVEPVSEITPVVEHAAAPVAKVIDAVAEPIAPVLEPAAGAVRETAGTLQPAIEAVQPVAEAVQPIAEVVRPVTDTLAPVVDAVRPVTDTIAPVIAPVRDALAPVAEPIVDAIAPITEVVVPVTPEAAPPSHQAMDAGDAAPSPTTQAAPIMLGASPASTVLVDAHDWSTTIDVARTPAVTIQHGNPGGLPAPALLPAASILSSGPSGSGAGAWALAPFAPFVAHRAWVRRTGAGDESAPAAPVYDTDVSPD